MLPIQFAISKPLIPDVDFARNAQYDTYPGYRNEKWIIFYTNATLEKNKQLLNNPNAIKTSFFIRHCQSELLSRRS